MIRAPFYSIDARKNAGKGFHRDTRLSDERVRLGADARSVARESRTRGRAIGRGSRRAAAEYVFGARKGAGKGLFAARPLETVEAREACVCSSASAVASRARKATRSSGVRRTSTSCSVRRRCIGCRRCSTRRARSASRRAPCRWSTFQLSRRSRSSTRCRRRRSTDRLRLISVMEGCSKYCSFCVVPYTRGAGSEPAGCGRDARGRALARQGVREITFLGQNVNAYRGEIDGDHADLAELLHYAADVPGIERLRFTTSHPVEFSNSLIEAYATLPKLVSHVHLPVQSGSDRVLAMMKRGHTILEYKDKIRRVRAARPDVSLTSDFIVGFPGETDEGLRSDAAIGRGTRASTCRSRSCTARGPERRRRVCPIRRRSEVKRQRLTTLQALIREQGDADQPGDGRHDAARAGHRAGEEGPGSDAGPHREQPGGQFQRWAARDCRGSWSTSPSPRR